jgi:uroporphyrinogen III methyltransferase/synthase
VGAGPGDPELITRRGAALLGSADVVLHDELVEPALRALARPDALVRSVGKRGADEATKRARQRGIERDLVHHARAGQSVVRLKGGDPFFFGRGAEEVEALRRAGVPFEVVPGVCSPLGATAYAGIALTHRERSSSVTFVTAVRADGALFDFAELAGLRGTVCVLMGTRRLEAICRALVTAAGRAPETPAAVVAWASLPRQRTVVGTLATVAGLVAERGIGSPTLLVVGEVVGLRDSLRWFDTRPLFGKRVLLLRAAHQIGPTTRLVRARGAEPIAFPVIALAPPPDPERVARAVRHLGRYDFVVLTSQNGVAALFAEIERQGLDARAFGRARVAAIGPATAAELARRGVRADLVAAEFVAESLADALLGAFGERAAGARVLVARALVAREILPERLRAAGVEVDVVPVYQTVAASAERAAELCALLPSVDAVLLTSSSTAERLAALCGPDAPGALAHCTLASIGPVTTRTAERLGLRVAVTAAVSTTAGLIDALERAP